jgi:hypothetical protein
MIKLVGKIIYFDRETINNMLEVHNNGNQTTKKVAEHEVKTDTSVNTEGSYELKLGVPFLQRIKFLLTGKLQAQYIYNRSSIKTINSTDLSDFKLLENQFFAMEKIRLNDIKNSLSFFRLAISFMKIYNNQEENLNAVEFQDVLNSYEGYDLYETNDNAYVRFNREAFLSNYKRFDLLKSELTLYCLKVGNFDKKNFDFMEELESMKDLIQVENDKKTLYPNKANEDREKSYGHYSEIDLYDVVLARIETREEREDE